MTNEPRTPRQIAEIISNSLKAQAERRQARNPRPDPKPMRNPNDGWGLVYAVGDWEDTIWSIADGAEKISPRKLAKLILDFERPLSLGLQQSEIDLLKAAGDASDDESVSSEHVSWICFLARKVHDEADRRYETPSHP